MCSDNYWTAMSRNLFVCNNYLRVCLQNGILRCRPSKSSVISWFLSEFQAFGPWYLSLSHTGQNYWMLIGWDKGHFFLIRALLVIKMAWLLDPNWFIRCLATLLLIQIFLLQLWLPVLLKSMKSLLRNYKTPVKTKTQKEVQTTGLTFFNNGQTREEKMSSLRATKYHSLTKLSPNFLPSWGREVVKSTNQTRWR